MVTIDIDISGPMSERERKILYNSARSCEIGKMLNGSIETRYILNYLEES